MAEDIIINMADFRRVYCAAGTASRMRAEGVDVRRLVQVGIPISELLGRGYDALLDRVLIAKLAAEEMAVTIPPADEMPES